jgi:hypothetical protein
VSIGRRQPGAGIRRGRPVAAVLAALVLLGGLVAGCAGGTPEGALILSGIVVDSTGRPVADARVALAAAPVEVPDIAALTGADGGFSISVPVTGVYRIVAVGDQGRAEETVDVGRAQAPGVRLVLRP